MFDSSRKTRRPTGLSVAAAVLLLVPASARADDYTWNAAGGGNWNEALKWSRVGGGTGVPGALDTATIDLAGTYTVNLTDNQNITTLTVNRSTATVSHTFGTFTVGSAGAFNLTAGTYTLGGGTLTLNGATTTAAGSTFTFNFGTWNGTGSASVGGAFNWNGGTIGGSGTVTVTGPVTLSGSTKFLAGTKTLVLDTGVTWSGGEVWIDGGTTFRLNPGRVLDNTADTALWFNNTGGVYDIQGTFRKSGGTGRTEFRNGPVYNFAATSALEVQSGTLEVAGNATYAGAITLGSGRTLRLAGGTQTIQSGATLNVSAGAVEVTGATVTAAVNLSPATLAVSGGSLTLNGASNAPGALALSGGGTLGGSGAVAVGGAFDWSNGTIGGSGTVTVTGPATLSGGGTKVLSGSRTLVLDAGVTWSGGSIFINNGTTFRVSPGRVLTNTADTLFWFSNTSGGTFDIRGTFRKTGTGTTTFNTGVVYDIPGTVEVLGGGLTITDSATLAGFNSGALTKGTWRVQGATLTFGGQPVQTIGPNATVVLDGTGATFAALDSLTTVDGTLRVLGGKTFTPTAASVTTAGALEVGAGSTFGKGVALSPAGRLSGVGTVTGAVTVGGTLAPGTAAAPVGTLTTGDQSWDGGGVYELSYNRITGTFAPGTDNDLVSSTGSLTVTATPANPFRIRLQYIGTEIVDPSPVDITIGTFAGGVPPTLDPAAFRLEGDLGSTVFDIRTQGNAVILTFTPVPEPATVLGLAATGLGLAALARRRVGRAATA